MILSTHNYIIYILLICMKVYSFTINPIPRYSSDLTHILLPTSYPLPSHMGLGLVSRKSTTSIFGKSIVSGGSTTSKDSNSVSRDHMGMLTTLTTEDLSNIDEDNMVRVRFVNIPPPSSSLAPPDEVVVLAKKGSNLLRVGDDNGVKVPRACRTGLCGTCTAVLTDPTWPGDENTEPGYQTIRCCNAGAMTPAGCEEMIVDLNPGGEGGEVINPMARFDDGWETSYVSDYQKNDREVRLDE